MLAEIIGKPCLRLTVLLSCLYGAVFSFENLLSTYKHPDYSDMRSLCQNQLKSTECDFGYLENQLYQNINQIEGFNQERAKRYLVSSVEFVLNQLRESTPDIASLEEKVQLAKLLLPIVEMDEQRENELIRLISEQQIQLNRLKSMKSRFLHGSKVKTLEDPRDGRKYKILKYGNKWWFTQNLNYDSHGSVCTDSNDPYCDQAERLYNSRKLTNICPAGWEVPQAEDFHELFDFWKLILGQLESEQGGWTVGDFKKFKKLLKWYPTFPGYATRVSPQLRLLDDYMMTLILSQDRKYYVFTRGQAHFTEISENQRTYGSVRCIKRQY